MSDTMERPLSHAEIEQRLLQAVREAMPDIEEARKALVAVEKRLYEAASIDTRPTAGANRVIDMYASTMTEFEKKLDRMVQELQQLQQ